MAGDFLGRLQVGLQGGFFDVATLGGASRVDVDGYQCFGRIDDDGAAGRQFYFTLEGRLDLAFDLEAVEQRYGIFVQLDLAGVLRHHLLDEAQCLVLCFDTVDQHFADILAQVVADGADDDVGFLIDQKWRGAILGRILDCGPELQQIVEVALQLFAGAAQACRADDQTHVSGDIETVQGFTQFIAFFTFDAARNATSTRIVRHQDQITAGQTDEGGQCSAFVTALFFFDLNDDFLAFAQDVLDVHAAFRRLAEVFARNFLEGEEAMALGAEVDESSFETGLDAGDLALVDVGFLLLAGT